MNLLYKIFRQQPDSREGVVIITSILSILMNLLLASVKIVLGAITGSIAIVSEGINNATDCASSLLTIVGTKLSKKRPDSQHPFGHGRVEYLTSLIIAGIILVTGAELLISSVKLIITPQPISVSYISLIIIAASAVVKLLMGSYTIKKGQQVDAGTLIAVGKDCRNDSVVSAVTIAASLIFLIFHYSVDAWAGIITSIFVLKSGWDVLSDAVSIILGTSADKEFADKLYAIIRSTPGVVNAADMMLHNYGPEEYSGSVNIEIDHEKTVGDVYEVIHDLQLRIMHEYGVTMVFGIYAVDADEPKMRALRQTIAEYVAKTEHVVSYHALYLPHDKKQIYCDLVVDYDLADMDALRDEFMALMAEKYPGYEIMLTIETEYV